MKLTNRIKNMIIAALSVILMLVSQLPLAAQEVAPQSKPGDLDTTFGSSGKVTGSFMVITEVEVQKDNKLIVAGSDLVARFNANGSLDASFGNNGKAASLIASVYDIAIQADGKILIGGNTSSGSANTNNFGLARYNADGTPDVTFGANGVVSTDFFGLADRINAIALQQDGSIVVGGYAGISQGTTDYALARYTAKGVLDPTFGIGGKVNTDMALDFEDIRDLAVQPDGYIVAAGSVSSRSVCVRYKDTGALDNGFGVGGKFKLPNNNSNTPESLVLQSDGRIVCAGGGLGANGSFDFMMFRLLANGTMDASFGNGGLVFTDFKGATDTASSLIKLKDGRFLLAGIANVGAVNDFQYRDFGIACYKTDGTPDPTFGTDGKVTTDFFNDFDEALGLVLQSNGRAVAIGRARNTEMGFGMAGYFLSDPPQNAAPVIESVKVKGKKLIVTGANFEAPSFIYLNGEKQKKSANDETDPTAVVIGLKAGNLIAPGATVALQVKNSNTGKISDEFIFTRPLE